MKTEQELGKGISLLFMASFFMEKAKDLLSSNSKWYRQENKRLLNLLIDKNSYIVNTEKRLLNLITDDVKIKESGLLDDYQGDKNDVLYLYNTEKKMFIYFMKMFLESTDSKMESFVYDLEKISNGEKLYDKNVLKSVLLRWNNYTGNIVKYKEEFIDEFLKDYE